jgi:hypothetical protein
MTDTTAATGTPSNDAGEPTNTVSNAAPAAGTAAPASANAAAGTQDSKATEPAVPEAYDLKMPEGVELDQAAATEFTAIAKELKLDQAAAQKLADVGAKMAQRQVEAHAKLVESWAEQVKTDNEIGGDKLAENLGVARKALEAFGTPELRDVLNATGLGNHPEVIRAFYKVGKAISEDRFVGGAPKGGTADDPAKKLFPNMN